MRSYRIALSVAGLGVAIAAVIITWGVHHPKTLEPAGGKPTSVASAPSSGHKFKLPEGPQTYQIVQAAEMQPKIIEAHIDPPDVHVGMTQTLSIIVQDPSDIVSATALIQTDHGTTTLPLALVGTVADKDLLPERYAVNGHHKLVALAPPLIPAKAGIQIGFRIKSPLANLAIDEIMKAGGSGMTNLAEAAGEPPKLKYSASWVVKDTHDTKYHTTFVVKDAAGRDNSITLAWSDACGIPTGGNWSLSSNGPCTISAVDGVDNGSATIDSYTLTLNSSFAFNPGYSISVTSGSIAVGSGGQLQKTYLWVHDVDGDGYPGPDQLAQDTQPSGYSHRYTGNPIDCNDSNASIYQNITGATDADQDGYGAEAGWNVSCVGASTVVNGRTYYRTSGGSYTWLDAASLIWFNDCNDNNNNLQVLQSSALDCDVDGYTEAAPSSQCVSAYSSTINGRTYYSTPANLCGLGGDYYLPAGQILGYPDANDFNGNVH